MSVAQLPARQPGPGTYVRCLRLRAAVAIVLALVLAACGGDDGSTAGVTAAPPPAAAPVSSHSPPAPSQLSAPLAVTDTAPVSYEWDTLGVGNTVHVDAAEEFTAVPGKYKGLKFLKTANADRFLSQGGAVVFQTNKDAAVLVAYDAQAGPNRPAWLMSWSDTGDALTTSTTAYKLFRKAFPAGTVTLGGNELGFSTYSVVVDDGGGLGNAPPTIVGNPPVSVGANRSYLFVPTATDADGDRLVFSASNLPAWLSLDAATGRLTGTPTAAAVRSYADIVVSVSDGEGSAALAPFAITVSPEGTNSPPTISAPPAPSGTQYEPYAFQPLADDPDGDPLTFAIANRPRWATLDPATGRLAGTPGHGDDGTDSNVIIQVSDGQATTALPPFTIRVYAPAEVDSGAATTTNGPPEIFGAPQTSAVAGTHYEFNATASDPDGDPLTYSIANRPAWATFSNTGRLSGTPGAANVGTYSNILVSVTDGVSVAALPAFDLVVGAAGTNAPPSISGVAPSSVNPGQSYSFTPTASDADGDTLTFTISGRPAWAHFDASTGRLSGTPTANNAGVHGNIRISVSDGQDSVALAAFSITVTAASTNHPPLISGTPASHAVAGWQYSFTPTASDPERGSLSFSIGNRPGWAAFNSATGRLSGTPTVADVGVYRDIVIRVNDGQSTTSLTPFVITIVAVGSGSATLSWTPPTRNTDGSSLTDLAGYRVYWGPSRGDYPNSVTLNNAGLSSYVVDRLPPGTWFFVVTALNVQSVESSFSNEGSKIIE